VGAALLVPVGGLAIIGVGTSGATTKSVTTVATSVAKLGTVGTITLTGISCTGAETVTFQCRGATVTIQVPIKKGGMKVGTALIQGTKWLITISSSGSVSAFSIKASQVMIKSATVPGINGCTILLPKITFTLSSGIWILRTKATTTVSVKGSCATKTVIQNEITGSKINSTVTY
jgi:hypothetical protein